MSATTTETAHLLLVDDDARLRALLQRFLTEQGFRVTAAADAAAARQALGAMTFDLMILDVMMPGESGLSLTDSLRRDGNEVPILMLTARGAPEDRIAGFETGWTTISASPSTRGSWRCACAPSCAAPRPPRRRPCRCCRCSSARAGSTSTAPELRGPEGVIRLTGGEAALLQALARRAGEVLSREEIGEALGTPEAGERAIDVQVTRLRRKVEADPREPRFIQTIRHRGYVLRPGP